MEHESKWLKLIIKEEKLARPQQNKTKRKIDEQRKSWVIESDIRRIEFVSVQTKIEMKQSKCVLTLMRSKLIVQFSLRKRISNADEDENLNFIHSQ